MLNILSDQQRSNIYIEGLITGRPFTWSVNQPLEDGTDRSNTKYQLGFTESDVRIWKEDRLEVLEIGPGTGESFIWLYNQGIMVSALEPALRERSDGREDARDVWLAKKRLTQYQEKGLVRANLAQEAAAVFGKNRFNVVFAAGPNFAQYSFNERIFFAQLAGIMTSIKPDPNAYLCIEAFDEEGLIKLLNNDLELGRLLSRLRIKFEVISADAFDQSPLSARYAIRIYRINEEGQDFLPMFIELTLRSTWEIQMIPELEG